LAEERDDLHGALVAWRHSADKSQRHGVVSANVKRRHLSASQRSVIAARFATLTHGTNRYDDRERNSALSIDEAAELMNVSKDVVKDARTVLDSAPAEVVAQVEAGELSVSKAAREIRSVGF